ncbi:MAG TPA: Tad domain-containing protein [Solirubrobacterales bacterium]|nr:Tad domain-containing protein [Solirubrobacterales bacterium]
MLSMPYFRSPAGEDGAVMVTVALALPVLILFASFVIDVGNWFEHQRHLQLQDDAGALAAAGDFRYPCNNAADEAVEKRAKEYSGTSSETGGYNHQVGGTPFRAVHFLLNSSTYYEQSSKVDPTVVAKPPCEAGMIDVKLTETDLPLFFNVIDSLTGGVPFINAHARVQIFQLRQLKGMLPVAVPDTNPQEAQVTFIDEETHNPVAPPQELREDRTEGGLSIWDNKSAPVSLPVNKSQIGMRVVLSGGSSTTCGQPLVECFDATSSGGILYVRGYSMAGSGAQPNPPLARNVYLSQGSCTDPYFSAGGCEVEVHAQVDFGPCSEISKVEPKLTAVVGGKSYALEKEEPFCASGSSLSKWKARLPIGSEAGPVPVELQWAETKGKEGGNECKNGNSNKCTNTFGVVQRSFAASRERSGPIKLARIWRGGAMWADSFESCSSVQLSCTYPVVAEIGIKQSLQQNAESVNQKPVELRISSPNQNQSLDCDPSVPNLRDEIAYGCAPRYARNTGTTCPTQSALWASEQPWECSAIQTGHSPNQVWQGMNLRIFGTRTPSECTSPNHWSLFPNLPAGDPRIVPVFLTPFGSFSGTGSNETVPVTNFGIFYVTGWAGEGGGSTSQSICPGDDHAEAGTIVGHFIKYVEALNEGGASEEQCSFNSPTPCVAVLTE